MKDDERRFLSNTDIHVQEVESLILVVSCPPRQGLEDTEAAAHAAGSAAYAVALGTSSAERH